MIQRMRWRILTFGVFFAVGTFGVAVGASSSSPSVRPQVACDLPGQVACGEDDAICAPFGAICDQVSMNCACQSTDMGPPGDGFTDGGGGAGGGGGGAGGGGGSQTGGTMPSAGPAVGGGMTGSAHTGCSYVPGSAR